MNLTERKEEQDIHIQVKFKDEEIEESSKTRTTRIARNKKIIKRTIEIMCTVMQASRTNSHLPIDSFFKYFLSMLGLIKYSGVRVSWTKT